MRYRIILLFSGPAFLPGNILDKLTVLFIYVCLAVMWNALAGYGGMISAGQRRAHRPQATQSKAMSATLATSPRMAAEMMLAPTVFAFGLVAFGFLGMGPVNIAVDSYGPVTDNAQSVYELSQIEGRKGIKEDIQKNFGFAPDFAARQERIVAVSLDPSAPPEVSRQQIQRGLSQVNNGNGVVILTDMLGGTPSNLTLSFLQEGKVEVITGVNLPMLMKLAQLRDKEDLREVALTLKQSGQKGITVASEVLHKK